MSPTPYNGYQPQPSPMAYQPPTGPQFAQFDASNKNLHADSLPAMPTWDTSRTRRVEDHTPAPTGFANDMELGTISTQPQQRARGGYNQVPLGPTSPITSPEGYEHFENQAHPYNSDLGTQRIGQQQTGYADFHDSPLSPAPTYRTLASTATRGGYRGDSRYRGTVSPPAAEYHNQSYFSPSRDQAWSPLNGGHHEREEYSSYARSPSPPLPTSHIGQYGHAQHEDTTYRPPSLLQIGRKPVNGSQREI